MVHAQAMGLLLNSFVDMYALIGIYYVPALWQFMFLYEWEEDLESSS